MGHYKSVLAAIVGLARGTTLVPGADQVKPASARKSSGGEEMILFEDLPSVFGASKYEQKPSEAPASVSIITSEEIQKFGYRTLSEILRSVRGFFTTYDRNYSYIGARGFDRPGDYDTGGQNLFFPEFDSPATNNGWARDADGDSYGHLFGKMSFGNFRLTTAGSSRNKQVPTASFGTDFNDPREKTIDQRYFLDLHYDRKIAPRSRFVGSVAYDGYRYKGAYPYSGSLSRDYGYGKWWTAEGQSITTLHDRHKVIGGAEVRYNTQQDQGFYDTSPFFLYLNDRRQTSFWALYAQ